MAIEIAERIVVDPNIMVGKPVIKGTRVPVELVLAKLAADPSLSEFFLDCPELTLDDVKACLRYASTLVAHDAVAACGHVAGKRELCSTKAPKRESPLFSAISATMPGASGATIRQGSPIWRSW